MALLYVGRVGIFDCRYYKSVGEVVCLRSSCTRCGFNLLFLGSHKTELGGNVAGFRWNFTVPLYHGSWHMYVNKYSLDKVMNTNTSTWIWIGRCTGWGSFWGWCRGWWWWWWRSFLRFNQCFVDFDFCIQTLFGHQELICVLFQNSELFLQLKYFLTLLI